MTKEQSDVVELAKALEAKQDEVNEIREKLTEALNALGIGNYARDPNTGVVYKVVKPKGTFMYYKDIDVLRTAKEGERGGTVLSKKEAEEAIAQGKV